ncbi:MAG: 3-deoxy-7-phosphoheptulonate synthase [FCB group bacterium]|nr:3-deoxy-7-phosphoheptulonate synthase [FCB group bacterium]
MIYSFEKDSVEFDDFVAVLSDQSFDYEVIKRDKIVVRIFGRIDDALKHRLDQISGRVSKLTMKKGQEATVSRYWPTDDEKLFVAGPCSVESESQLDKTAGFLSGLGIKYLRGGAFKPRTNSNSFQGLGREGLRIMAKVASGHDMKVVTEVMDKSQLDDVVQYADIIQVGSRNMFNYSLLTALGAVDKPVLLKRGMAATIDEWAQASQYIIKGGNGRVILCERGIRTFEPRTRFTLDILAVPIAQKLTGLPVIVDVSHAAGERSLVPPLVGAALAAGADGIMVEVHPDPENALSDGLQSLTHDDFKSVFRQMQKAESTGKSTP